jgi:riboflavin synthase
MGELASREGSRLRIEIPSTLAGALCQGDSVAVNGVCLTAIQNNTWNSFEADLLPATLSDTTLGIIPVGATVNLEPALRAGDPLGGHIVQGHVDGTTKLLAKVSSGETWRYNFALPNWLSKWIVPKGSICINGVSLTVQELAAETFTVELIPETLRLTNLGKLLPGQQVNLEADLIVKTISELVQRRLPTHSE